MRKLLGAVGTIKQLDGFPNRVKKDELVKVGDWLLAKPLVLRYSLSGSHLSHVIIGITVRNAKGLINYLNYCAKGDNNYRFQDPQPFASVSQLPAALRLPQKKHAPGLLEYVSCGFCHF